MKEKEATNKKILELEEEVTHLQQKIRRAKECVISLDGFRPKTEAEKYCIFILEQIYEELLD